MVFKLVLHASKEVLCNWVVTSDTSCAVKLITDKAIVCICFYDLLCLVIAGHNYGYHEASNQYG